MATEQICEQCGEIFRVLPSELRKAAKRGHARRYCGRECQHQAYKGEGNPKWRGGRFVSAGYIYIYKPDHPYATKDGYVMEHRLVAEEHLQRFLLPEEEVHHKNHVKDDNRWSNLKVCESSAAHRREHAYYEQEPCGWCGTPVMRSAAHRRKWKRAFCGRKCAAAFGSKKAEEAPRAPRTTYTCKECGGTFEDLASRKRSFCDKSCSASHRNRSR
jgi:hypothetical protein